MRVLAIDPGVKACACVLFDGLDVCAAWFETFGGDYTPLSGGDLDKVVVERPIQQGDRTRAARPKDLMDLSWAGALLAGAYCARYDAQLVALPANDSGGVRGWKGSEPKPRMHARLWAELGPAERRALGGLATERAIMAAREKGALDRWSKPGVAYYARTFTTHNLLDAACLGAVHQGWLERV